MALTKLRDFWDKKSIKLSDTFDVFIDFNNDGSEPERFVECCGFTIPKLEYEEETYAYGNMEQIFLIPKYDSCKELVLEFFETTSTELEVKSKPYIDDNQDLKWKVEKNNTFNSSVILNKFLDYISLDINQKYINSNGVSIRQTNYGSYSSTIKSIPNIIIKIMDNKLRKYVYEYSFYNLQVINYTLYNLEYQSDSPCTLSISFSFEDYKKENLYNDNVIPYIEGQSLNDDSDDEDDIIINDYQPPPSDENIKPPENTTQEETSNNEEPSQPAGDLKQDENTKQEDNKEEPATETEVNSAPPEQPKNEEPKAETPSTDKGTTPNQDNGTSNDLGGEQPGADKPKNEEKGTGEKGQDAKPSESETKPAEESKGGEQSQPDPNYHKDELGNEKYESEEGTLYKTEDGKTYYEDKESGKVYDVDNGFVESNAHEGLVSETKNGDTQYYTSVVDNGEEVYRDKNVTTEVNTSEHARHTQDNAGQDRTPPNIGANESGSQNNTTVSQTSEGGGQSAHDAAEEARKRKEEEMKAAEEAKKTKAMEEARRGQTRGATPPTRGVGDGGSSGPSHAEETEGFYNNGANR